MSGLKRLAETAIEAAPKVIQFQDAPHRPAPPGSGQYHAPSDMVLNPDAMPAQAIPTAIAGQDRPLVEGVEDLFGEAERLGIPGQHATVVAAAAGGGAAAVAMTPDQAAADDLASPTIQRIQDRQSDAAVQELMARVAARKAKVNGELAPAPAAAPAAEAVAHQQPADSIAGVVTRNIIDIPGAMLSGVRDAAQEAVSLIDSAVHWIDENVAGLAGIEKDAAKPELPDVPAGMKPSTLAGGVAHDISQFLTGFALAGKAMRGVEATGKVARVAKDAVKGFAADFTVMDPHAERLSNLMKDIGVPENAVTDYLAADPNDGEAEARMKNALEGLGIGAAVGGLLLAGKALRTSMLARRQVKASRGLMPGGLPGDTPRIAERDFLSLGDPASKEALVDRKPPPGPVETGVPDDVAAKGLTKGKHEPDFFINFARIDTPDDVKNTIAQMADAMRPEIEGARRGTQTFDQIKLNAEQLNAWDALQARRPGQPLNAEQSVAARTLWASSAAKLTDVAKLAVDQPNEANLFAFRKMLSIHHSIQQEVIAARTETARALASWRIPVGSDAMRAKEVEYVLNATGGAELARDMARKIAAASQAGMTEQVEKVIEKGAGAKTADAFQEAWINGLLSGPKTHIVNMMSNSAVILQQMAERGVAARISQAVGTDEGVALGEATAQWFGMVEAAKDMFRYGARLSKLNPFENPAANLQGQIEQQRGAISAEAFGMASDGFAGKIADGIGNVVRLPGRALEAEDKIFKTFGYRMELNAQAVRQATREAQQGIIPASEVKNRIADLRANPPDSLKLAAVDQALYQTFTSKAGPATQKLMQLRDDVPGLKFVMPFVRTPANILKYTFERTPLAPLMSGYRADIMAGGARRDLALTKVATGSAVMAMVADLAMSGNVSGGGPQDPAMRDALVRSGWQPYSIKVGDRWYAYNRADPLGSTFGLAADMVEILNNSDLDPRDTKTMEEVSTAAIAAIGNSVMNKTYLSGMADLIEAIGDRDGSSTGQFIQRLAGSVVPTGVAEVTRGMDPNMREVRNLTDAMMARTPGLSDNLPKRRDLWGRPRAYSSGLGAIYDAFSPIYSRKESPAPIDREVVAQKWRLNMPGRVQEFDGEPVDLDRHPGAFSRYLEITGQEPLEGFGNRSLYAYLNDLVSGRSDLSDVYAGLSNGPDGDKEAMVKKIISVARAQAKVRLRDEFPTLDREIKEKQRIQMQRRGVE